MCAGWPSATHDVPEKLLRRFFPPLSYRSGPSHWARSQEEISYLQPLGPRTKEEGLEK